MVFLILTLLSAIAVYKTPVDAIPDLSENQVIVMTTWSGQSPKNIEDQITYPITVSMQGLPNVKNVRSGSMLGVSMVTVIFEDGTDIYFARDRVAERLNVIKNQLPMGVMPMLGPDATGIGQIFMYTLEQPENTDNKLSLTELRSIQDFTVRYELQSLPGVAEVASVGGHIKQYQVVLDPVKMEKFGVMLPEIIKAIQSANNNVSGKVLQYGEREIAVQGIGFFENPEEIGMTVLGKRSDGLPLLVKDIANVRTSGMFRRGVLADATGEKVGGVVVMRYGENPLEVINAVKTKIENLEKALPAGVTIKPFYDRTELIQKSISTLKSVLIQMLLITALILWVFLLNGRTTVIASVALVSGVLMTFLFMYLFGIPSNIMSLGGIAIAIGTMVDSIIVVTENAYQKFVEYQQNATLANVALPFQKRLKIITDSTLEVGAPIVFAIFIICFSFVPIFALEGMEGKLFQPLAFTNIFAMAGALIASLFFVPLACAYFFGGKFFQDHEIPTVRKLQSWYEPVLRKALANRKIVFVVLGALAVITVGFGSTIGSEFMPPLNEGSLMYMPMTVPDVTEAKARELLIETNKIFSQIPEVENVVGKAGRSTSATDPAPLAMLETFITLKPKSEWRNGMTKDKLIAEMSRKINFPNLWNGFTQPIIGRVDMISTGIRSEVGIKIFGDDPQMLEDLAIEVEHAMGNIPGATGVVAIRTSGLKYVNVDLDEAKLAEYGIPKSQALALIEAGVGGKMIGTTIEGREKYNIEVKFERPFREDVSDVKSLMLMGSNGKHIPLSAVADIRTENGPAVLKSEDGKLLGAVQLDVSGRDLGGFIKDARKYLEENLELPSGYSFEFDGQYKNQVRAKQKLSWVVPAVILVIFLTLYLTYKDLGLVSIVMLAIPLSLVGGILALFLAQYNFSVAVSVGFIALFGNAVETGVVIVLYLENALKEKIKHASNLVHDIIHDAILEGATKRLRPVLMTAFTSILGLLPMLVTNGVGAEVQKPLAMVVVGGLITSITATLIVIPVFFSMLRERTLKKELLISEDL